MHSKNKTDIGTISDRMTRSGQRTLNGRRKRPKNEKINGEVNCGTSGVHCQRSPSELIAAYNKWRNVSLIRAAIYQMLCKHLFGLRRGDVGGVVVLDMGGGVNIHSDHHQSWVLRHTQVWKLTRFTPDFPRQNLFTQDGKSAEIK